MKKLFTLLIALPLLAPVAMAEERAYITDDLEVTMRTGQSAKHKIIRMLKSGRSMSVIERNSDTGYSLVRLSNGSEGWVLTRHLVRKPVAKLQLAGTLKKLETLKSENSRLKKELQALTDKSGSTESENKELLASSDKLQRELEQIRTTAAGAIQTAQEKEMLQERVVNLERDLQTVNRENQALKDSSAQDWFLIGAGVLFGGMLLGFIIPKISWRRKSSWDSF